jgi:hypothetical protein
MLHGQKYSRVIVLILFSEKRQHHIPNSHFCKYPGNSEVSFKILFTNGSQTKNKNLTVFLSSNLSLKLKLFILSMLKYIQYRLFSIFRL